MILFNNHSKYNIQYEFKLNKTSSGSFKNIPQFINSEIEKTKYNYEFYNNENIFLKYTLNALEESEFYVMLERQYPITVNFEGKMKRDPIFSLSEYERNENEIDGNPWFNLSKFTDKKQETMNLLLKWKNVTNKQDYGYYWLNFFSDIRSVKQLYEKGGQLVNSVTFNPTFKLKNIYDNEKDIFEVGIKSCTELKGDYEMNDNGTIILIFRKTSCFRCYSYHNSGIKVNLKVYKNGERIRSDLKQFNYMHFSEVSRKKLYFIGKYKQFFIYFRILDSYTFQFCF